MEPPGQLLQKTQLSNLDCHCLSPQILRVLPYIVRDQQGVAGDEEEERHPGIELDLFLGKQPLDADPTHGECALLSPGLDCS